MERLIKSELERTIALLNRITGNEDGILSESAIHVQCIVEDIDHQKSSTDLYGFRKDIAFEFGCPQSHSRKKYRPSRNTYASLDTISTDWLPDSIISTLQEREDFSDIQSDLESVDKDSVPDNTTTFTDRVSYKEKPAESSSDTLDSF